MNRGDFETKIENRVHGHGLSEETVREISKLRSEPEEFLELRLKALQTWQSLSAPKWGEVEIDEIDYSQISFFSAPGLKSDKEAGPTSLEDLDPRLLETYHRLGIPLEEQERLAGVVAVDAVFDSVSVATTYKDKLAEKGIIFCSMSEAIKNHFDLVIANLGSVVPFNDNYYAALNCAVFSDGSFIYIPAGVHCPIDLSSYFRINNREIGQFERTLIIAEKGSSVSYLEGCTAPQRDNHQLHAGVVEVIAHEEAKIRYSTVQNWFPGDNNGKGGIYNLVTKRGKCLGRASKISWVQVEVGSAVTWKYPGTILMGRDSESDFYSVSFTDRCQEADTGTKMIHLAPGTKSTIVTKSIAKGRSRNTFRSLVKVRGPDREVRSFTQCDSLVLSEEAEVNSLPCLDILGGKSITEHEASVSKINEEQLSYLIARGIPIERAISMIVHGFCQDVLKRLPFEFSIEVKKLFETALEGKLFY